MLLVLFALVFSACSTTNADERICDAELRIEAAIVNLDPARVGEEAEDFDSIVAEALDGGDSIDEELLQLSADVSASAQAMSLSPDDGTVLLSAMNAAQAMSQRCIQLGY